MTSIKKIIFFTFLLLSINWINGQTNAVADDYLKTAEVFKSKSVSDSALVYYKKAATIYEKNGSAEKLMNAYERVLAGQVDGLNLKKLKGHSSIYRLRAGDSRLVFQQLGDGKQIVLYVGKRDDQTYRDF